jgi:hypothetical protein
MGNPQGKPVQRLCAVRVAEIYILKLNNMMAHDSSEYPY